MKKSLSANKTRHAAWRLCPSDENTKYLQVPWQVPALPRRLTGGEGGATPSWNDTFGTGREPHLKGRCHTAASEAPGRLQGASRAPPGLLQGWARWPDGARSGPVRPYSTLKLHNTGCEQPLILCVVCRARARLPSAPTRCATCRYAYCFAQGPPPRPRWDLEPVRSREAAQASRRRRQLARAPESRPPRLHSAQGPCGGGLSTAGCPGQQGSRAPGLAGCAARPGTRRQRGSEAWMRCEPVVGHWSSGRGTFMTDLGSGGSWIRAYPRYQGINYMGRRPRLHAQAQPTSPPHHHSAVFPQTQMASGLASIPYLPIDLN